MIKKNIKHQLPIVVLTAVSVLLYLNTFSGEFVYDDLVVVLENPEIKSWNFWGSWGFVGRFTRTLSLMLDFKLFGDVPYGYHFQNILWHALSVIALYFLLLIILKDQTISFLAALFFAVHPIHVETIANISNRKDILCLFFSLVSFIFYIRFIDAKQYKKVYWFFLCLLCWVLALNSKEVAIVLPLSLIAYEILFLPKEDRFLFKKPLLALLCFFIGVAILTVYLVNTLNFSDISFIETLAGYREKPSFFPVVITSSVTFWKYIFLIIFPFNLSPDHRIHLYKSISDPTVVFSFMAIIIFVSLIFYLSRKQPIIAFGFFWFLAHYLPVSNIIPSVYAVADRYMYIPSIGFCLILAYLCKRMSGILSQKAIVGLIMLILLAFSFKTVSYCKAWQDNVHLWSHNIKVYPDSYRAYDARGVALVNLNRYEEAIKDLDRAIELLPKFAKAYTNRGIAFVHLENYQAAIKDFNKTVELGWHYPETHTYRGYSYFKIGNYSKAIKDYERAIEFEPGYEIAYYFRALAYGTKGKYKLAIDSFSRAVELRPDYLEAYFNRGIAYGSSGLDTLALEDFNMVISINSEYAEAYNSRGILYNNSGRYDLAISDYEKAIELDSDNGAAYYNLGLAYAKLESPEKARFYFGKAVELGIKQAKVKLSVLENRSE